MIASIKARKIGNSVGVIIPNFIAAEMNIRPGTWMKITFVENEIILNIGPTDRQRLKAYLEEVVASGTLTEDLD